MDYLVIEGYKNAAERLAEETGLDPAVDLESIENRMLIRSAIQRGDVEEAIGRVNDLDSEVSVCAVCYRVEVKASKREKGGGRGKRRKRANADTHQG